MPIHRPYIQLVIADLLDSHQWTELLAGKARGLLDLGILGAWPWHIQFSFQAICVGK